MRKEQILLPLTFGLLVIAFISTIYFSSARFVKPPSIVLPDEFTMSLDKISYENKVIYEDIIISEDNFRDIIAKLNRPKNYEFTVENTVFAFETQKKVISFIDIAGTDISVERELLSINANESQIIFKEGELLKIFDRSLYTNDEIIGIPSYEDLILTQKQVVNIDFISENDEDVLKITLENENITEIYTVSLATGILTSFELFEDDILKRSVFIYDLALK